MSPLYEHYDEALNFFANRAANAFAESFNAKIKAFRASLRGTSDIRFFPFRPARPALMRIIQIIQTRNPALHIVWNAGLFWKKAAATYSPAGRSTIGADGLNFSVRNGKRWDLTAITT